MLIKNKRSANWGFPKGHIEGIESELETALREISEETGLTVRNLKYCGMNLYPNNLKTKTMNKNLNFSKNFYIINITKKCKNDYYCC